MAEYRYQMRNSAGEITNGMVAAASAMEAAASLRAQGGQVLQLAPAVGNKGLSGRFAFLNYSSGPSQRDVLNFTTQLAVMVRAGIGLRAALDGTTVSLPEAIQKMTSLSADRFGLSDRGLISKGKMADILVYDPINVRDMADYTNPHQHVKRAKGKGLACETICSLHVLRRSGHTCSRAAAT